MNTYFTGRPCKNGHTAERYSSCNGCVECTRLKNERWSKAHPEANRLKAVSWAHANPGKANAKTARRHTAKLQRTPAWADHDRIREVYVSCPPGYEVDHIIPLQGKLVSGLHVHENLQHLTESQNRSKNNTYGTRRTTSTDTSRRR